MCQVLWVHLSRKQQDSSIAKMSEGPMLYSSITSCSSLYQWSTLASLSAPPCTVVSVVDQKHESWSLWWSRKWPSQCLPTVASRSPVHSLRTWLAHLTACCGVSGNPHLAVSIRYSTITVSSSGRIFWHWATESFFDSMPLIQFQSDIGGTPKASAMLLGHGLPPNAKRQLYSARVSPNCSSQCWWSFLSCSVGLVPLVVAVEWAWWNGEVGWLWCSCSVPISKNHVIESFWIYGYFTCYTWSTWGLKAEVGRVQTQSGHFGPLQHTIALLCHWKARKDKGLLLWCTYINLSNHNVQ